MKKNPFILPACLLFLLLTACQPKAQSDNPAPQPNVDVQGTTNALSSTMVAETLAVLSTPNQVISPFTAQGNITPTNTGIVAIIPSATVPMDTATLPPTPTASFTVTPTRPNPMASFTPSPIMPPGYATPTETLHPRFYGTQPPKVPYGQIALVNKANAEVYVSLQVTLEDGSQTVIEYPVKGAFVIDAPTGKYFYVAWVGGKKMTGEFRLARRGNIVMTFGKNAVTIKATD